LEKHARLAQALVFAEGGEVALGGRERLLKDAGEDVVAAPVGAHAGGAAPELVFVEEDHLVGDGGEGAHSAVAVAALLNL